MITECHFCNSETKGKYVEVPDNSGEIVEVCDTCADDFNEENEISVLEA
jgi:ribosome-binding protein aMBF1 (putative translation factor)